ncbi:heavy metal-associated isoprenylated plant protein 42-like [Pyrus x bretschneideri]|uniref:heavy metal-associated isoprenylated plant protein 42-like n=1 Tax=Pyrus x bretschneideri TaxID=225117 RepID=UPI00202DC08F|nr:heavy metal-associated isoprenylated plant protein 42-like [Pyrus x bretschneideri]
MEQHGATFPICTIKMKYLRCCAKCPLKVKEKLQKLDGVEDINVDPEQGLLRVQGKIDPMVLTRAVQTMDKKAELWSFQKEPFPGNIGKSSKYNFQIGNECSCDGDCDDHESSSDDESPSSSKVIPKKQYGILRWIKKEKTKKNGNNKATSSTAMPMPVPRPRPGLRPPMAPPMGIPANRNFYGPPRPSYRPLNPYYQPVAYHRPSPPPYSYYGQMQQPPPYSYYGQMQRPPYSYFRSRSPPKVNPIVHYTSYADNYRYP